MGLGRLARRCLDHHQMFLRALCLFLGYAHWQTLEFLRKRRASREMEEKGQREKRNEKDPRGKIVMVT